MIEYQSETLAIVANGDVAAAVTFSSRDSVVNTIQKISYKGQKNGVKIRFWGKDNNLPHYREQLVEDNNIVPALIQSKRDITFGTGLFAYKKKFVPDGGKVNIEEVPIPEEAEKFFDKVDIDEYLLAALRNQFMHSNIFTEYIRDKSGKRIVNMKIQECKHVRLGEQNDKGQIDTAYISGSWATAEHAKDGITEYDKVITPIPLFDAEGEQKHFILHTGDKLINDGYYNSPTWFGSRGWIELANAIPIYHQSNIDNGYAIRFHIEVPKGYFFTSPTSDAAEAISNAETEERNKKQEFLAKVNDLLAGKRNVGRALFTEYDVNLAIGKEYPGIRITPINVDLKDEALLQLFEKSNTANISAQGIHPTLANIETQGRLSSGSEIRNAYIMYLAIKTPIPRRIVLKAINLVKKINEWPSDIYYGFGDTEITTLDDSPTGMNQDAAVIPDA